MNHKLTAPLLLALLASTAFADWTLAPFVRPAGVNPVITPRRDTRFACPMRGRDIRWEALHTFNPAAVVRGGQVWMLYRAEDDTGEGIGGHTSRLGLAVSDDGLTFRRERTPVFFPDADAQKANEWDGGCEDPRLVEDDDGRYVLTYTQWNRKVPRLAIATSRDLVHWTKHGPAFTGPQVDRPHKSGAIVTRLAGDRLKAARINGKYWMYWGEGGVGLAHSPDLVHWTVVERAPGEPAVMLDARPGRFDSGLSEAGPPPILTPRGILMIYNGKNHETRGDPSLAPGAYSGGQALFDATDPSRLVARTGDPFFRPEEPFERTGQYPTGTTFLEALVHFHGRWLMYYGCADSLVAVATCDQKLSQGQTESQSTWTLASDQVELQVTRLGAQTAPVTFYRNETNPVRPYYVSPWQGERRDLSAVPVLVPLRGDFFCLPFGGNAKEFRGERHPPHGETAGSPWTLVRRRDRDGVHALDLALATQVRPGRVKQTIALKDGENVVYKRTTIEGFAGPASMGHHAILALPADERALLISTRPFAFGMTAPFLFSDPAKREYQALAIGARFTDLARVPSRFRDEGDQDCSAFPARRGYADLLQTFSTHGAGPDWLAAVNTRDGYLFYTLKDAAVLPARTLWMENHGRHGAPWDGRNACLGVEDTCSFFDLGVAESAASNAVSALGIPTAHELKRGRPFHVNYIQGAIRVPPGFGNVARAEFDPDRATFHSITGQTATARVDVRFLTTGQLR